MAQITEPGGSKSLNVELNIVPFIDLMSCMTAFLLVTAVWISIAQVDVKPAGNGRDGGGEAPQLSVLIESDAIWIGVSRINELEKLPRRGDSYDWATLEQRLAAHKTSPMFVENRHIEIAAASDPERPVLYQALIGAMDIAVKTGFSDVGISDPRGLSAYPHL
ncbi:MAG: ExbD/TolR family protein [Kofleriaceae bacterium]